MRIFDKTADLKAFLGDKKKNGQSLGFVPTMGALHRGHISLVQAAKEACDFCVCSIFVNPNQFNDKEDLKKYPRTPEADIKLLESVDCDVLFMPEVNEIYPEVDNNHYSFGYLDEVLEGAHRPGHFNGVAQVVRRLFEIVEPDKAFFGSKDYQQVMIVKALVKQLDLPVTIVACPILRENDGLAMSSRNTRLTVAERQLAANIPLWMNQAAEKIRQGENIYAVKQYIENTIKAVEGIKLDYFEVCDAETLSILDGTGSGHTRIALIALFVGNIRLIDNIHIDPFYPPRMN